MSSFWNNKQLGIGALVAFFFLLLGLVLEMAQRVAPMLLVAVVALALAGCEPGFGDGTPETTEEAAARKACYADAQAQLSPQWSGASRQDRAVAAMKVISICEGQYR